MNKRVYFTEKCPECHNLMEKRNKFCSRKCYCLANNLDEKLSISLSLKKK